MKHISLFSGIGGFDLAAQWMGWENIAHVEWKRINPDTNVQSKWEKFPNQPPLCIGDDGLPGKLDGITFSNFRKESIKAGGNAIVPQVAFQIFKAIEQYNQLK